MNRSLSRTLDDEGSVTIEAALALSALVVVAAAIVAGISAMAAYVSAVDIAGAAARAHAIGVDYAPPRDGVNVTVSESGGMVNVSAQVPSAIRTMEAKAAFPVEFR